MRSNYFKRRRLTYSRNLLELLIENEEQNLSSKFSNIRKARINLRYFMQIFNITLHTEIYRYYIFETNNKVFFLQNLEILLK